MTHHSDEFQMPFEPASDILSDYIVLDLTRVRSGPTCVRQLSDWGANVIKIENPDTAVSDMGGSRQKVDIIALKIHHKMCIFGIRGGFLLVLHVRNHRL